MREPPSRVGIEPAQQARGGGGAGELHAPVDERERRRDPAGNEEPERHRRVEVTAGDVPDCRDHHGNREPVRQSDSDEGKPAVDVDGRRAGQCRSERFGHREDRPGSSEDEREGADELGKATPKRVVVHRGRKVRSGSDGVVRRL